MTQTDERDASEASIPRVNDKKDKKTTPNLSFLLNTGNLDILIPFVFKIRTSSTCLYILKLSHEFVGLKVFSFLAISFGVD